MVVSVDVLKLIQGGKWETLENESTDLLPNFAYAFSKEKLSMKNQKKWKELFCLFDPPSLLVSRPCCDGNGYFGCETSYDDEHKLKTCNTWFRCLVKQVAWNEDATTIEYEWFEMIFLTRWQPDRCIMLCFNTPGDMLSKLNGALSNSLNLLDFGDPLSMYIPLMDEIVKLYDLSVWAIRDLLRPFEKKREGSNRAEGGQRQKKEDKTDIEATFTNLQKIMRHSIHVGEVLTVAKTNVKEMRDCHATLLGQLPGKSEKQILELRKAHNHMNFQVQLIQNMGLRQNSNHERLASEASFIFNKITQNDSKVLRQDSKAMKTVAILTMLFLPATFTSAIFGMNFFNFSPASPDQPEKWSTSGQIYMFWTAAGLLTFITLLVWVFEDKVKTGGIRWRQMISKRMRKRQHRDPEK